MIVGVSVASMHATGHWRTSVQIGCYWRAVSRCRGTLVRLEIRWVALAPPPICACNTQQSQKKANTTLSGAVQCEPPQSILSACATIIICSNGSSRMQSRSACCSVPTYALIWSRRLLASKDPSGTQPHAVGGAVVTGVICPGGTHALTDVDHLTDTSEHRALARISLAASM
jgi:hypothetical protein